MIRRFTRFACIDWSGAVGAFQKGIAVAVCDLGRSPPCPVKPPSPRGWSRAAVLDWLFDLARNGDDILVGIDFSPSLPYLDHGAFFPGWQASPRTARDLWRLVDELGDEFDHLSAQSVVAHPVIRDHFRHVRHRGAMFEGAVGRTRRAEARAALPGPLQVRPASCFNLIGANQVGKSSLTGMRVLHRLGGAVPVWPFDDVPRHGPLIVEIYTTIAARAARVRSGRSKIRDAAALSEALESLGSRSPPPLDGYDDHVTDAIVTAAWLRRAAEDETLWRPDVPDWPALIETEGWTFGVI